MNVITAYLIDRGSSLLWLLRASSWVVSVHLGGGCCDHHGRCRRVCVTTSSSRGRGGTEIGCLSLHRTRPQAKTSAVCWGRNLLTEQSGWKTQKKKKKDEWRCVCTIKTRFRAVYISNETSIHFFTTTEINKWDFKCWRGEVISPTRWQQQQSKTLKIQLQRNFLLLWKKTKQEWTQPIFIQCFREYIEFAKHITNSNLLKSWHVYISKTQLAAPRFTVSGASFKHKLISCRSAGSCHIVTQL